MGSDLSPDLVAAYRSAIYRVIADPAFDLHIDRYSSELAAWQKDAGVDQSALITAANPHSKRLPGPDNQRRQRALEHDLAGWLFVECENHDPFGQWPIEHGFLVAGMGPDTAARLAADWGQNAWVHIGSSAIPRLMMTGSSELPV